VRQVRCALLIFDFSIFRHLFFFSCWAFSTVENIESVWKVAGHPLVSLSVQQIVDCDNLGDEGCNGGDTPTCALLCFRCWLVGWLVYVLYCSAYQYVINAGGLESAADYHYTATDGKCKFDKSKVRPLPRFQSRVSHAAVQVTAKISSWAYATKTKNETEMAVALVNKNPLSICVEADSWQFYSSGVVTKNCGTDLDHCVLLVGYAHDAQKNVPYWIIRNSWDTPALSLLFVLRAARLTLAHAPTGENRATSTSSRARTCAVRRLRSLLPSCVC
jgi:hypothetical protein